MAVQLVLDFRGIDIRGFEYSRLANAPIKVGSSRIGA